MQSFLSPVSSCGKAARSHSVLVHESYPIHVKELELSEPCEAVVCLLSLLVMDKTVSTATRSQFVALVKLL